MGADVLVVLIIVLIIVLVWRGPRTLPKLGEALGRGVREARKEAESIRSETSGDGETPAGGGQAGEAANDAGQGGDRPAG
jgi:Sec-independent protein translocase protein TatA